MSTNLVLLVAKTNIFTHSCRLRIANVRSVEEGDKISPTVSLT